MTFISTYKCAGCGKQDSSVFAHNAFPLALQVFKKDGGKSTLYFCGVKCLDTWVKKELKGGGK